MFCSLEGILFYFNAFLSAKIHKPKSKSTNTIFDKNAPLIHLFLVKV